MTTKIIFLCFLIIALQACTAKEKYEFSQRSQRLRCEDNINGSFSSNNYIEYNDCLKNTNIPYEEYNKVK